MEYALRRPAPVVAKEALIRALRDGDRDVLEYDERVLHVCEACKTGRLCLCGL